MGAKSFPQVAYSQCISSELTSTLEPRSSSRGSLPSKVFPLTGSPGLAPWRRFLAQHPHLSSLPFNPDFPAGFGRDEAGTAHSLVPVLLVARPSWLRELSSKALRYVVTQQAAGARSLVSVCQGDRQGGSWDE